MERKKKLCAVLLCNTCATERCCEKGREFRRHKHKAVMSNKSCKNRSAIRGLTVTKKKIDQQSES